MKSKVELLKNLHNYRRYNDYLSWMSVLMNTPKEYVNANLTPSQLIDGCCEDFGVYFCIKYGIPLWAFDGGAHYLLIVDGRYYDGFNNTGVDNLKDLEFVSMLNGICGRYVDMTEEEMRQLLEVYDGWKDYDLYKENAHLIDK